MLILLYQDKLIRMTYIWSFHETTDIKTIDSRKPEAHFLPGQGRTSGSGPLISPHDCYKMSKGPSLDKYFIGL